MARAPRNYQIEYAATQGTAKGKLDRAARNRARAKAMKAGKVHKGDGKEVDHINYNPRDNSPSNVRIVSRKTNREKQPKRS